MNIHQALRTLPECAQPLTYHGISLNQLRMRVATQLYYYDRGNPARWHSLNAMAMRAWLDEVMA